MKIRSALLDDVHDELDYVLTGRREPLARVLRWCSRTAFRIHHRALLAALRLADRRCS